MIYTFNQLFLNDGTSFARLPLWLRKSRLIKTTYEIYISGEEEETEPYRPPIDLNICTIPILNVIWHIMIGHTDLNGQNFNDVFNAANYLDIRQVMEELCNFFINSPYLGKLEDQNDVVTFVISQNKNILNLWWDTFMYSVNNVIRNGPDNIEEITRLWSKYLFWEVEPANKAKMTCEPSYLELSHFYLFWEYLVILPGIEHIEKFLWETGLFNALAVLSLPYHLCPIMGYSTEPLTNNFSNDEIARYGYYADVPAPWLLRFIHKSPTYLLATPDDSYSIIIKWIQCNFKNYVNSTIRYVPKDYTFKGRSLIDWAAESRHYIDDSIIRTLLDNGHKPTKNIYDTMLDIAVLRRQFLTGWITCLTHNAPDVLMDNEQMETWVRTLNSFRENTEMYLQGHEYAVYTGNAGHIIRQLQQIYDWNIHRRNEQKQFAGINLESLMLT